VAAIRGFYKPITQEFDGVGDKMVLASKIADFVSKVKTDDFFFWAIRWFWHRKLLTLSLRYKQMKNCLLEKQNKKIADFVAEVQVQ
jgi:hypothetical protein